MPTDTQTRDDANDRFDRWSEAFKPSAYQASPWLGGRIDAVSVDVSPNFVRSDVDGRHQILAFTQPHVTLTSEVGVDGNPDHFLDQPLRHGDLLIGSANQNSLPHATRWMQPIAFTSLSIDHSTFANVAASADQDLATIEFLNLFPAGDDANRDRTLFALMLALRDELLASESAVSNADPAGRVYAEALMQAAAAHILRHHTARGLTPKAYTGGLTARQVARVRDYARAHLADDVSLADLAAAADLSPYHFAREFKRSTGETAHGMLRRKRMEHAAIALCETPDSVASVAVDVGYASPSRFAAAFRKHTGVSPTVYRRDR